MAGFAPANAFRATYGTDAQEEPYRLLINRVKAGLEDATTDEDREALRSAAFDAVGAVALNDGDRTWLLGEIDEAIDGPPPFAVHDPDYIDPVTGYPAGKVRDLASFIAENEDFKAVADAVAGARTSLAAQEIVQAALQGDYDLARSGAPESSLTWSTPETFALHGLLSTVPPDGTVEAAKQAAVDAELARAVESYRAEMAEPESVLDAEVARADAEVSA